MVPRGDRTKTVLEPMLTDQWFVAMSKPAPEGTYRIPGKSITEVALEAVSSGEIKFHPENWVNTYNQWLNNIQDWCIVNFGGDTKFRPGTVKMDRFS
ncbi:hypothetical protein OURE66S_01506 [Oligella ureolytica]